MREVKCGSISVLMGRNKSWDLKYKYGDLVDCSTDVTKKYCRYIQGGLILFIGGNTGEPWISTIERLRIGMITKKYDLPTDEELHAALMIVETELGDEFEVDDGP